MAIRSISSGLLGPPSTRSVLRIREKYLLFAVILTFMIISLIGMVYLPELKTSKVYINYIKPADSLGPQLLGLIPERSNDIGEDRNQPMTAVLPPPYARFEDEIRLRHKIQQHFNLSQEAVIPKPNLDQAINNNGGNLPSSPKSLVKSNHHDNWKMEKLPSGLDPDPEIQRKRENIRSMMIIAWDNYKKYAWGENELKPVTQKGHSPGIFGQTKLGATIVDGMDTLYIMGLMDRFSDGRNWIANNLDFDNVRSEMSVFETIIRYVGGLLSCYAFTKDRMFLNKAVNITNKMLPAFDTPTGLPHALIKPAIGTSRNYAWASQGHSILSEVGTLSLEFAYLTALTGNDVYFSKIDRIRTLLDSLKKPDGLYPNYISPKTGKFGQKHVSIGALGDSFYEYLLKLWLLLDKKDTTALRMYNEAIDAIEKHLVQKSSRSGLVYVADLRNGRLEHKMGHLACFAAGMFALGAKENAHDEHRAQRYLKLGQDIGETCRESYVRTKTGLGPEVFAFSDSLEAQLFRKKDAYYILRPEVIEGWFYLWRITKDPKYREWAWEAVQAIEKHCLSPNKTGYSGLKNVDELNPEQDDVQQSFFLAETLKYLYLIFSSDDLMPFDQWVFNTEAHPLPIKNRNGAFPVR